jgi:hypothetical protein
LGGRRDDLVKFLRVCLSALGWANDETNRNEVVKLIASDQGIDEEDAAKQLRRLPAEESMNLKGLEGVLDLRVRFGLVPPMGKELSVYCEPAPYQQALKV